MNNDFHDSKVIFDIFDGLELDWQELNEPFEATNVESSEPPVNGNHAVPPVTNGGLAQPPLAA